MNQRRRSIFLSGAATALLAAFSSVRAADRFPWKPVRLIVPLGAGGPTDVIARALADRLQTAWGQTVVVENRAGANGIVAAQAVRDAAPDGHTVLVTNSGIVQNFHLRPNAIKADDFAPVNLVALSPSAFAVNGAVPARTLQEFIALVRANPGKYSYASVGQGSSSHILGEMFNRAAKIDMLHVPYKGESVFGVDLLSGQVTAAFGSAGGLARLASGGKARLLAIADLGRAKAFPDLPTFAESGVPELGLSSGWLGVFVGAHTPRDAIDALSSEVAAASLNPAVQAKVADLGYEPNVMKAAEFSRFMAAESAKWAVLIRDTGVKADS